MNPTDLEMQNIVNEFDSNGNGKIDFDEFVLFMARRDEWRREKDVKYVREGDGKMFISVQKKYQYTYIRNLCAQRVIFVFHDEL